MQRPSRRRDDCSGFETLQHLARISPAEGCAFSLPFVSRCPVACIYSGSFCQAAHVAPAGIWYCCPVGRPSHHCCLHREAWRLALSVQQAARHRTLDVPPVAGTTAGAVSISVPNGVFCVVLAVRKLEPRRWCGCAGSWQSMTASLLLRRALQTDSSPSGIHVFVSIFVEDHGRHAFRLCFCCGPLTRLFRGYQYSRNTSDVRLVALAPRFVRHI